MVMLEEIRVKKAAQHNLKHIDVNLPRNRLIVITGPSGSGKSSLAFDTLFAEGQRRYIECLSTYARQYIEQLEKPEVESIEGLSPSISIDQKTISFNPRSTVGTVTETYDLLRLLYARVGVPHVPVVIVWLARRLHNRSWNGSSLPPMEPKSNCWLPWLKVARVNILGFSTACKKRATCVFVWTVSFLS